MNRLVCLRVNDTMPRNLSQNKSPMSLEDLHQNLPLDSQPRQSSDFTVEKIPCCWILTRAGEERKIKLNDSSMLIWQMCDGENSVGDMIAALEEAFPDVPDMDKDVQRALDELLAEELIALD